MNEKMNGKMNCIEFFCWLRGEEEPNIKYLGDPWMQSVATMAMVTVAAEIVPIIAKEMAFLHNTLSERQKETNRMMREKKDD